MTISYRCLCFLFSTLNLNIGHDWHACHMLPYVCITTCLWAQQDSKSSSWHAAAFGRTHCLYHDVLLGAVAYAVGIITPFYAPLPGPKLSMCPVIIIATERLSLSRGKCNQLFIIYSLCIIIYLIKHILHIYVYRLCVCSVYLCTIDASKYKYCPNIHPSTMPESKNMLVSCGHLNM